MRTCARCGEELTMDVLRVRPLLVVLLLGVALGVAYVVLGAALYQLIEGMEPRTLASPLLLAPAALLLATAAAWTLRFRRGRCPRCPARGLTRALVPVPPSRAARLAAMPERRRILGQAIRLLGAGTAASVGALGAAVLRNRDWVPVATNIFTPVEKAAPRPHDSWRGATVKRYRRLGRTDVLVSDISLGSSTLRSLEVARLALDRGVTYVDTAPDYARAGSEELLGRAMMGRRNDVFVASKFCTPDGHLAPGTPVPKIIEAVEGSLRRLRTDRIDLLHVHSCDRIERLLAPSFHEAFDRLKEQGKARFLGVSTHTPNLRAVADAAIASDRFDVLMLAYHHGMGWELDRIVEEAAARDVAVVAMKTLKGARHESLAEFRDDATSFTQAAFRWVLSNPAVSCLVVSFSEVRHVDEYLHASGTELTSDDRLVLARYDRLIAGDYCRPHCGACLSSCVESLPIHDVLRHQMYFEHYRAEREAMRLYAALGAENASRCVGCPAPCAGACPHGLPIQEKMLEAHRMLSAV